MLLFENNRLYQRKWFLIRGNPVYLSKSFESLQTETTRYYGKDLWEKIGCRIDDLGLRPL